VTKRISDAANAALRFFVKFDFCHQMEGTSDYFLDP
jgi:hypothetical protein